MGQTKRATNPGDSFPDALRAAIARRGHTQREAAAVFGVTPQYVSEWLAGRRVPGPRLTRKVARYLGLTNDQLRQLCAPTYREELQRIERDVEDEVDRLRQVVERLAKKVGDLERKIERRG